MLTPSVHPQLCLILSNPETAFSRASLPVSGVGLARLEFVIARCGLHPVACLAFDGLKADDPLRAHLAKAAANAGCATPAETYTRAIAQAVGCIAAAFYPKPVIVRCSDFKSACTSVRVRLPAGTNQ